MCVCWSPLLAAWRLNYEGRSSTGSAECIWKVPLAAAKRSWIIPEHNSQVRCFWLGWRPDHNTGNGYKLTKRQNINATLATCLIGSLSCPLLAWYPILASLACSAWYSDNCRISLTPLNVTCLSSMIIIIIINIMTRTFTNVYDAYSFFKGYLSSNKNRDLNPHFCDATAVLYQLSHQANLDWSSCGSMINL